MDVDYVIRLTISAYQLTEEWEERSLLRLKIRKASAGVLKNFILTSCSNPVQEAKKQLFENLSQLEEALKWARREKLISRKSFIFLKEEYGRVRDSVNAANQVEQERQPPAENPKQTAPQKVKKPKTEPSQAKPKPRQKLKAREAKIIQVLGDREKAQVNELKEFFPDISKRTLRRDIDSLLQKNMIVRHGEWNDVYYTLS